MPIPPPPPPPYRPASSPTWTKWVLLAVLIGASGLFYSWWTRILPPENAGAALKQTSSRVTLTRWNSVANAALVRGQPIRLSAELQTDAKYWFNFREAKGSRKTRQQFQRDHSMRDKEFFDLRVAFACNSSSRDQHDVCCWRQLKAVPDSQGGVLLAEEIKPPDQPGRYEMRLVLLNYSKVAIAHHPRWATSVDILVREIVNVE